MVIGKVNIYLPSKKNIKQSENLIYHWDSIISRAKKIKNGGHNFTKTQ